MSVAALLDRLRDHGIALRTDGDELLYHPRAALTLALLAELRRHKWALLAILASDAGTTALNTDEKPGAHSTNRTSGGSTDLAWRVAAMCQRHPRPWRAVPTLTVRDVPRGVGGCLSCGEPLSAHLQGLAARCGLCLRAAHFSLAEGDVDDDR